MYNQKCIAALIMVSLLGTATSSASASDLEMMQLSQNLGNVLASEAFCELTYKHSAIAAFIEGKVPADNLSFASELQLMTSGAEYQLSTMSASAKVAHCTQIKRVAKSYGFTD